ncbi:MAG: response regulator [Anaerohalosphaeraceae bacterium]|nr:response regulator [Anaerohalosphaeraceae bacterium]
MKVLIAEDDTASRIVLQNHLQSWGYKAYAAENGQVAWDIIQTHSPQLIVADWMMPVMDGLELCKKIRGRKNSLYTYIIFLTSKAQNEDIVTALDSGADDFLAKPFDRNVLRSRLAVGARIVKYENQLHKSEERYQHITDSITDYIFTAKITDGKISKMIHNDTAIAVTGYSAKELNSEQSLWLKIVYGCYKEQLKQLWAKCLHGESIEPTEYQIIRKDQQLRWVKATFVPQFSSKGKLIACDCLLQDINERKIAEENMKLAKERAEKLNRQLELTYKKLMETAHCAGMTEATANVLHNVGNALNSINVAAGLVAEKITRSEVPNLKKISDLLDKNQQNIKQYLKSDSQGMHILTYLKEVSNQLCSEQKETVSKLSSLIKNVKNVKGIISQQRFYTENKQNIVPTSIDDIIESAIQINNASLELAKISVIREYEDAGTIHIDKHQTIQILVNLIDNAANAMEKSGRPERTLRIKACIDDDHKLTIVISDNGIGIDKKLLDKIFQQGYTTRNSGHGFGLYSCIAAAKNMQGTIIAKSEGINRGATFVLELPLKLTEVKNVKPD